tara:strand:- start:39414 stop:39959 length:546 start_codon:yes stop_codon:yes gene_type:complete
MSTSAKLVLLSICLFSCTNTANIDSNKVAEIIDIRVYSNDKLVINGEGSSFYILSNTLESIDSDEKTNIRIFFNENASFYLLKDIQSFFNKKDASKITTKIFSTKEMSDHFSSHSYIDLLVDNSILFNGHKIHIEDLETALSSYKNNSTNVLLSINDRTIIGTVFDVQRKISHHDFNIIYM